MYGNVNRKKKKDGSFYQARLDLLYDEITTVEESMDEIQTRIDNIRQQKILGDQVYQFLLYFDRLYDKFTDSEKKEF